MSGYMAFLRVHKPDCLKCGHLVEFATEQFDDCHYSKGNTDCPAKVFSIQVGVSVDATVKALVEAKASNRLVELSQLMAKVAETPEPQRTEILEKVAAIESLRQPKRPTRSPVAGRSKGK